MVTIVRRNSSAGCCTASDTPAEVVFTNPFNTLAYRPGSCIRCGLCEVVCPHGVFVMAESGAQLVHPQDCMECGACQLNCITGAITVSSGVGCAAAMVRAAITGGEPTCGCDDKAGCC